MKIIKLKNGGTKEYNGDGVCTYYMPTGIYQIMSNGDHWPEEETHRADGPAIIWANGKKEYVIMGKYLPCKTPKEFREFMHNFRVRFAGEKNLFGWIEFFLELKPFGYGCEQHVVDDEVIDYYVDGQRCDRKETMRIYDERADAHYKLEHPTYKN
jgi:hypothetical protein